MLLDAVRTLEECLDLTRAALRKFMAASQTAQRGRRTRLRRVAQEDIDRCRELVVTKLDAARLPCGWWQEIANDAAEGSWAMSLFGHKSGEYRTTRKAIEYAEGAMKALGRLLERARTSIAEMDARGRVEIEALWMLEEADSGPATGA